MNRKKAKQNNQKKGKSAYARMFFRGMWNVKSRILAIFGIVALGVGFLFGLISTAPDMYETVDEYYDSTAMMDLQFLSPFGFTDDDVKLIAGTEDVLDVQYGYTADALLVHGEDTYVTRMHSIPKTGTWINSATLVSGRFPEKAGECVVESGGSILPVTLQIGDILYFAQENDTDAVPESFTVVGTVESSCYFSIERETSTKGNGQVSLLLYTPEESFEADAYHVLYVRSASALAMNCFDKEYTEATDALKKRILEASAPRRSARLSEVRQMMTDRIAQAEQSLTEAAAAVEGISGEIALLNDSIRQKQIQLDGTSSIAERLLIQNELNNLENQVQSLRLRASIYSKLIQENEQKVSDARVSLEGLKEPVWYSYDRGDNLGYKSYKTNAEKVSAISKVFPVFFFLVALLVSLTTMTRMVDEERLMIGTMKALGYSERAITQKYMLYAAISGVFGCVVGLAVGNYAFPLVINNAYSMMYATPPLKLHFHVLYALISSLLMLAGTLFATYMACRSSLKEPPAALLRPKAPKNGKRIFLEKITPLWKRLKFTYKVTARNLLLYKKRFFMTVIGVAGCTALLLTAFGIRDSIGGVVVRQYEDIFQYNLMMVRYEDIRGEEWEQMLRENGVQTYITVELDSYTAYGSDEDRSLTVNTVATTCDNIPDFVRFRNRKSGERYTFTPDSVFISERMSDILNLKKGDTLTLKNGDGVPISLRVDEIVENYIGSYVYIGNRVYRDVFGTEPVERAVLAKADIPEADRDAAVSRMLSDTNVMSVTFTDTLGETFDNMIDKINYIVYVLIVCAGALAFIVLYNLININIAERQREIATIKVLGFYDKEVNSYVFREIFALTGIGAVLGLLGGILLHHFVVRTIEMDIVMFGHVIHPLSYLLAFILTVFFSLLVSVFMTIKLKKINMVESLKSAE